MNHFKAPLFQFADKPFPCDRFHFGIIPVWKKIHRLLQGLSRIVLAIMPVLPDVKKKKIAIYYIEGSLLHG